MNFKLYRELFHGRQDVVAEYWESKKSDKKGYLPICRNKFVPGVCLLGKNGKSCAGCDNADYVPMSKDLLKQHLAGKKFLGVYPLLLDNTCWFLAMDLDDKHAIDNPYGDLMRLKEVFEMQEIDFYPFKSRSGKGYHIYVFFKTPVPAWKARIVFFAVVSEAGLKKDGSFDRFFPNQDEHDPDNKRKMGNLIAGEYQGEAIKKGNTLLMDPATGFEEPYSDQFKALQAVKRTTEAQLDALIKEWNLKRDESEAGPASKNPDGWFEIALHADCPESGCPVGLEEVNDRGRDQWCEKMAGRLDWAGKDDKEKFEILWDWNILHCKTADGKRPNPLSKGDVRKCINSAKKYNNQKRKKDKKEKPGENKLFEYALKNFLFFYDSFKEPYIEFEKNGHREFISLYSEEATEYLSTLFYTINQKIVGRQMIHNVKTLLSAYAKNKGEKITTFIRTGEHEGNIYIDLMTEGRDYVKITKAGWENTKDTPAKFIRPEGVDPFPICEQSTDKKAIFKIAEILSIDPHSDSFKLCVAFMLHSLHPSQESGKSILVVDGTEGTGKTTLTNAIGTFIDPLKGREGSMPGKEEDVAIACHNNWLQDYGNISYITREISDALCRATTGGRLKKRQLYTDDTQKHYIYIRPVLMNGLVNPAIRHDLLSRCLNVKLDMREGKRKGDTLIKRELKEIVPEVMPILFNALSRGLRNWDTTPEGTERLADFEKFLNAAEDALPWEKGALSGAYKRSQAALVEEAISNDLLSDAIVKCLEENSSGIENMERSALRTYLLDYTGLESEEKEDLKRNAKKWPAGNRQLNTRLKLLAGFLERIEEPIRIRFPSRVSGNFNDTYSIYYLNKEDRAEDKLPF